MTQTQRQGSEQLQTLMQSGQISGSLSFNGTLSREDEEMSKSALSTFRAKEEEIEKKKLEVKEKVQAQLGRIEEETKRLATIREVLILSFFFFNSRFCTDLVIFLLRKTACMIFICLRPPSPPPYRPQSLPHYREHTHLQ